MQETEVQSLDWEDSLEKKMTTNSSILAWRIPQTEEPGGLLFTGGKETRLSPGGECWTRMSDSHLNILRH